MMIGNIISILGSDSGEGSTQQKVIGWNSVPERFTVSSAESITIDTVPAFTSVYSMAAAVTGCGLTVVPNPSTSQVQLTLEDGTLSVTARSGYTGTLYLYKPIYG